MEATLLEESIQQIEKEFGSQFVHSEHDFGMSMPEPSGREQYLEALISCAQVGSQDK